MDYLITEAVAIKAGREEEKAREEAEKERRKEEAKAKLKAAIG